MKEVEVINDLKAYQEASFFEKMFKIAAREAQEENRKKGIYNVYAFNGRLVYELPNGELTYEKPFS